MNIPNLNFSTKQRARREFHKYSDKQKALVVRGWLFEGKKTREMDVNYLETNPEKTTGHESMNILHYLGLKREFQGLFRGVIEEKAIRCMQQNEQNFDDIISIIQLTGENFSSFVKYPDELATGEEKYKEGRTRVIRVNAYERNPKARKECLDRYGACCVVCRFDFLKVYGEMGRGFIHVHHLKEIASEKENM